MAQVIQSLATRDPGHAPDASQAPGLGPVSDSAPAVDDSGLGLALFLIFTAAVLLITSAVAFLAVFTAWPVLGLVFGLDVLVTFGVGAAVFTVLGDGKLIARRNARVAYEAESPLTPPGRMPTQVTRAPIAA